ncbi:MAG: transglycosylase SLT domain-containing protein, partial [Deltaproteobacteria bacterium]|nr:transglycosylase SLT domain-containing protein [Deltaproteobacteria bacterium]
KKIRLLICLRLSTIAGTKRIDPLRLSSMQHKPQTATSSLTSALGTAQKAVPTGADESRFDSWIKNSCQKYGLPFYLIKSQISAESSFNPNAISPCGAKGLMQLMPETDFWLDGKYDGFDPEGNIDNGVRYDRWLFDRFPEISSKDERLKFMLASYNCGRGYVNKALRLARDEEFGFEPLALVSGKWQTWDFSCRLLSSLDCYIEDQKANRKRPDFVQVWEYVEKIWRKYQGYIQKGEETK